jgi:hypothetical protein
MEAAPRKKTVSKKRKQVFRSGEKTSAEEKVLAKPLTSKASKKLTLSGQQGGASGLKVAEKTTDTVRVAGKSRPSGIKSGKVGGGPSRIPSFLDSSSESSGHLPIPRCVAPAATKVVARQTPLPIIDVSSVPALSAPSSGGEASSCLQVCDSLLNFLRNSFIFTIQIRRSSPRLMPVLILALLNRLSTFLRIKVCPASRLAGC